MRGVLTVIIAIGVVNFALFVMGTFVVHGDAVNARSSCPPGDYVSEKGVCHPVSHAVYVYSTVHSFATIALGLLTVTAAMILHSLNKADEADPPQSR